MPSKERYESTQYDVIDTATRRPVSMATLAARLNASIGAGCCVHCTCGHSDFEHENPAGPCGMKFGSFCACKKFTPAHGASEGLLREAVEAYIRKVRGMAYLYPASRQTTEFVLIGLDRVLAAFGESATKENSDGN